MICPNCQAEFAQKTTAGNPRKYCSKSCGDRFTSKRRRERKRIDIACRKCQQTFSTTNHKRRYCTDACRLADVSRMTSAREKIKSALEFAAKYPHGYGEVNCGWCGEIRRYDPRKQNPKGFHPECTIEARQASYRIKTVKRQKIISQERITVKQVVERWGSDCHICKESIDTELPRTSRFGLTLDHVMPLSKGGTDEIENIKPAHWICNVKKSDKVIENA